MAITNHERVGKALDLLREGLRPFVEREFEAQYGQYWVTKATEGTPIEVEWVDENTPRLDVSLLLRLMWDRWNDVFRLTLGHAERSLVSELREVRNKWAHQESFSGDDAYRALDSAARLLTAVSAPEADEVEKAKQELLRLRYDEQVRNERRRSAGTLFEGVPSGSLKPWREVVSPHPDVASGRYQQAEFAADLWQVYLGEGSAEYRDPVEFFRRTYLTESLKDLLVGAVRRLAGEESDGDPVVQLQTNFGGGKTHSMLALYHLFGGATPGDLPGVDAVMAKAGVSTLPSVNRVVMVGNKISPGNPVTKPDGTVVRTLWGELAWQLGGREAYERLRADDEKATSPGDVLRTLMNDYGPCLILIDEWVAYARQLHDTSDLPGGSFDTHFTFAQALTESAKLARNCLIVISLPASDTAGSPHAVADNAEVGGERGRAALDRLRNAVGRVEASWRPASAEEGFEIVRRRLFEPLVEPSQFLARDTTARGFFDLYGTQHQEFPPECRDSDYEKRLKAAYPIHPEIFDRLYNDWSTLIKFQRTRGVLRLMAVVIHSLWSKGDRNPIILPASIPIDDPRVQFELTRYLSDNWVPVIEKDVDGPNALPLRIDGEVPNLGRFSACRRVARTIYLGSAPTATAANRGIEDRRVKLGCVMPGESPAVFGDALRRLSGAATYLYAEGARYWYSTQPTVTKLAEDRAEQYRRDPDKVAQEIERRLRADLTRKGDFERIHALPQSGQDVPDDTDSRLVVLGIGHPYSKDPSSPALAAAKVIYEFRGNSPRLMRNTLAFLAVDQTRLQDLDEAARRYLAWDSIVAERDTLDLTANQVQQAGTQRTAADGVVNARLPEAYQWLLVPVQASPQGAVDWQAYRLSGEGPLAVRASKKLRNEELLITTLAGSRLRMDLDRVPLWRDDRVPIRQLAEDFARYPYLPRLQSTEVLLGAVTDGVGLLTWEQDGFAYADAYDETAGRYVGLRCGERLAMADLGSLLVRPEVARRQRDAEARSREGGSPSTAPAGEGGVGGGPDYGDGRGDAEGPVGVLGASDPPAAAPKRFHGSVSIRPLLAGSDAGKIAEEVLAHLAGLIGAHVRVTLEIEAEVPDGVPENVVRIVTENSQTLKFESHGFERE